VGQKEREGTKYVVLSKKNYRARKCNNSWSENLLVHALYKQCFQRARYLASLLELLLEHNEELACLIGLSATYFPLTMELWVAISPTKDSRRLLSMTIMV
jgi:hypothetical protein